MRPSHRQQEFEELVSTFETALKDYGAISKSELEEYVAKELQGRYGPDDLREILPKDLWSVVREYIAEGGNPLSQVPEDLHDVAKKLAEKSDKSPAEVAKITVDHAEDLRTLKAKVQRNKDRVAKEDLPPALHVVYGETTVPATPNGPSVNPEPAHAGTIGKEASISDLTLSRFYDSEPVKKGQKKPDSPALRGLYDTLEDQ